MATRMFPADRVIIRDSGGDLTKADDDWVLVWADADGTVPAAITVDGTPVSGSRLRTDREARLPLFEGPDGVDLLWGSLETHPSRGTFELAARPPVGAPATLVDLTAHEDDTTNVHGVDDTAQLRLLIEGPLSPRRYGAVFDGVADDGQAILDAIAALPAGGGEIELDGAVRTTVPIVVNRSGVKITGRGSGSAVASPVRIVYDGAPGATTPVMKCESQRHGFAVSGLVFDGNAKAGIGLWVDVADGAATHAPQVRNCHFAGYTSRGLVLGKDSTSTSGTGQLRNVVLDNLSWEGGTLGAIGMLLNAQNAEHVHMIAPYFDPTPGKEHAQHIFARAGGLSITALLTTRSTGYAIDAWGQVVVVGWRAEEALLLKMEAVDPGAASFLAGVTQRPGLAVAADQTILLNHTGRPVVINGASLYGSIVVGPTNAKTVDLHGVAFPGGGGFVVQGTSAASGVLHNATTGEYRVRGADPMIFSEGLAGATGYGWRENTANRWWLYKTGPGDANVYLRDMVNARMQVTFTPGASAVAAVTTLNSELNLLGPLNHDGTTVGFFAATPVTKPTAYTQTYSTADKTLGAYTSDSEGTPYIGTVLDATAAQVADLNALRVAYENLRVFVEDLAGVVNAHTDDLQALGLVG